MPTSLQCQSKNCGRFTRRFRNSSRRECSLRKKKNERRVNSLQPAKTDLLKVRRPYPPVVPKYANPDEPSQVWSGRGARPRWVTEKLASGLTLEDLSIGRGSSAAAMPEEDDS